MKTDENQETDDFGEEMEKQLEIYKRSQQYVAKLKSIIKEIVADDLQSLGNLEVQIANATAVQAQLNVSLTQILGEVIIEYIKESLDTNYEKSEDDEDTMKGYS
mgnify:CR=1 FL=1